MLDLFNSILRFLKDLLYVPNKTRVSEQTEAFSPYFTKILRLQKTPANHDIEEKAFVIVIHKDIHYWTLFKCPCGCRDVISLPMRAPHNPKWTIETIDSSHPTLYPSIWRSTGCLSHFWVSNGEIKWCGDSGLQPHLVRPDLYKAKY